jgi:nucleoside-diphosphate-sugar epimerase
LKILVTGSSGFVGSKVMEQAQLAGWECIGQCRAFKNGMNAQHYIVAQMNASADWGFALEGIDCVVHCAASVHKMHATKREALSLYREVNTEGTLNLARQAVAAGVKRFIFLSSIKVNGESTSSGLPFSAFDDCLPEDPYGISKSVAEEQLFTLGKETNMEIVIIRPPLVYGEGVKANFASLLKLVSKGFPLPFRAINRNKRSLVSVYNLVDLIGVCIDHPKAANQVFLVSDDNDLSTSQMVALMASVQGKVNLSLPVPVWCFKIAGKIFKKETVVDRLVGSLQLDIEHTKNTLDWAPPYSVEHGFRLAARRH